jgi:hypothetical protein
MTTRKLRSAIVGSLILAIVLIVEGIPQTTLPAESVNGTWRLKNSSQENEFKILALDSARLKVQFSGLYKYRDGDGHRTANTGNGEGAAVLKGNVATFVPNDTTNCKITIRFGRSKLSVDQEGICGFGFNVSAEGSYKRVSSEKPKFD